MIKISLVVKAVICYSLLWYFILKPLSIASGSGWLSILISKTKALAAFPYHHLCLKVLMCWWPRAVGAAGNYLCRDVRISKHMDAEWTSKLLVNFFYTQIYWNYVSYLFFFVITIGIELAVPRFEFFLGLCQESPIIRVLCKHWEMFTSRLVITPT